MTLGVFVLNGYDDVRLMAISLKLGQLPLTASLETQNVKSRLHEA